VNVDYSTDQICKTVLWLSIAYSFYVVINVAFRPEFSISNPYAIKGHMRKYVWDWPQRFPVLISFSLFYCLKLVNDKKIYFLFLMLILTCLYFTFTRTVYLAIISGIFCYTLIVISNLVNSKKRNPTKQRKSKKKLLFIIFLMIVSIKFLAFFDPYGIYAMIIERTIKPISFIFAGVEQFSDSDLSRIIYWSSILDIVDSSPFFGSGFGNIYLFESVIGSAHSQYMDILVRTGYAGFIFYLFFWIKALYFYLKKDQYIFCGLISIFVYGLFHETTKLTYSGVLFFLLLNKTYIQPCLFKAKD
jgi:O-antigen ligase